MSASNVNFKILGNNEKKQFGKKSPSKFFKEGDEKNKRLGNLFKNRFD